MICSCSEKITSTFSKFFFDFQCLVCIMPGLTNTCPCSCISCFERKTQFEHSKSRAIYQHLSLVTCWRPHKQWAAESKLGTRHHFHLYAILWDIILCNLPLDFKATIRSLLLTHYSLQDTFPAGFSLRYTHLHFTSKFYMTVPTVIDSVVLQCLWMAAMSLNEKKKP